MYNPFEPTPSTTPRHSTHDHVAHHHGAQHHGGTHRKLHTKGLFLTLNAVVLLLLAASTAAYASLSKKVTLTLDGKALTVRTFGGNVEAALASDGIVLNSKDEIQVNGRTAGLDTQIGEGDEVRIAFAKPVAVAVDGRVKRIMTHERTVGDALRDLGVRPAERAYVSASLTQPLSRHSNKIVISNLKKFSVTADGETAKVRSSAPTVEEALARANVRLDSNDEVEPGLGDLVAPGDRIRVTRIEQVEKTEEVEVNQPVEYREDKTLEKGTDKVLEPGRPGRARERVLVTVADGHERSRLVLASTRLSAPRTKIVARGTAPAPEEPYGVWDKIAQCESGGNWQINTGNGYYGGLQFSEATWHSVGGTGLPSDHSREVQIKYAKILQARSGWGQWGCAHARND